MIRIIVTARAGEGKSTIAQFIHSMLRNVGLPSKLIDDDVVGSNDVTYPVRLSELSKSPPEIIIETKQLARSPKRSK